MAAGWTPLRIPLCLAASISAASASAEWIDAAEDPEHMLDIFLCLSYLSQTCLSSVGFHFRVVAWFLCDGCLASVELLSISLRTYTSYAFHVDAFRIFRRPTHFSFMSCMWFVSGWVFPGNNSWGGSLDCTFRLIVDLGWIYVLMIDLSPSMYAFPLNHTSSRHVLPTAVPILHYYILIHDAMLHNNHNQWHRSFRLSWSVPAHNQARVWLPLAAKRQKSPIWGTKDGSRFIFATMTRSQRPPTLKSEWHDKTSSRGQWIALTSFTKPGS